jgi:broad specificity phosphatase PhoE
MSGPVKLVMDERLREREFGIFDRLTRVGIQQKFPEEAAHRTMLGKFYHRPPGGESWADVILRLRSALNTINLHYCDRRVLIVCHQVVVLCMRYILEELTEQDILRIDKQAEILNCGIIRYDFEPDADGLCMPKLAIWNQGAPLEAEGAPKTAEPDRMTGTR